MMRKNDSKRKSFKYDNEKLYLSVSSYANNGRLAIMCECDDGELYGDITVNLPEYFVPDNSYAFINQITKDCGLEKVLMNKKIIKSIFGTYKYNYGKYDMVQFDLEELKKYDPIGLESFLELNSIELEKSISI